MFSLLGPLYTVGNELEVNENSNLNQDVNIKSGTSQETLIPSEMDKRILNNIRDQGT